MKNDDRASKYDPIVEEVELLESNPEYAHVKLPDGRDTTVSTLFLAPQGDLPPRTKGSPRPAMTEDSPRPGGAEGYRSPVISTPERVADDQAARPPDHMATPEPSSPAKGTTGEQRPARSRRRPPKLAYYVTDF